MTKDKEQKRKRLTKTTSCLALIFTGIGGLLLIFFVIQAAIASGIAWKGNLNFEHSAQVGDFVGGVIGALWSFSGILLFYSALLMQKEEFSDQRKEFKNHREEFALTRITNIFFHQLERIDKQAALISIPLRANAPITDQTAIFTIPRTVADTIGINEPEPTGDLIITRSFQNIPDNPTVNNHLHTLKCSILLCLELIDQKEGEESLLDANQRNQLFLLLADNLDIANLYHYIRGLSAISIFTKQNGTNTPLVRQLQQNSEETMRVLGRIIDHTGLERHSKFSSIK